MPIFDANTSSRYTPDQMSNWKPLFRIEDTGQDIETVKNALDQYFIDRLLYAEGDSWFDKFTPFDMGHTNLLDALRLPNATFNAVVDASHIGDTTQDYVSGWQLPRSKLMFESFDFAAILYSGGGNDLIGIFSSLFHDVGEQAAGRPTTSNLKQLQAVANLEAPSQALPDEPFDQVIGNIKQFMGLRDAAAAKRGKPVAPFLLHGYDYAQPRPAKSLLFTGTRIGIGPWTYPALQHAGMNDAQMLAVAKQVIDKLNTKLRDMVSSLSPQANVWLLDQRGILTTAQPGSTGTSGDWMDEIHCTGAGYTKLAQQRWNPALAQALNIQP